MKALTALAGMVRRSSLENPSTPLTGAMLSSASTAWPFESKSAGADPLRIAAALRCVQVLASSVAGCPLRVTNRATHEEVHIPALAMYRAGSTPFEVWETVVAHLALRGNAYLRKVRTADGRIVDLVPIVPTRVQTKVADDDDAAAAGLPWVKKFEIDGGAASFTSHDILHIPGFSWGGVTGVSVVENLRRTWELATAAEQVAAELYDHGLMQAGYLQAPPEVTVTPEQNDILKARWRAKAGGIDSAHDVLILDHGVTFKTMPLSPEDAQFLETRKFSTSEIARIFGVPGWIVNDQEKSTSWGTGMEQQFIAFVIVSLKPYFQRIEQRVARELCDARAEKVEFKIEGLLRGDSKARAAFYASGIQHGWMVPNEPRELEDMPPVPWGDEPYRPYNEPAGQAGGRDDDEGDRDDDDDAEA